MIFESIMPFLSGLIKWRSYKVGCTRLDWRLRENQVDSQKLSGMIRQPSSLAIDKISFLEDHPKGLM